MRRRYRIYILLGIISLVTVTLISYISTNAQPKTQMSQDFVKAIKEAGYKIRLTRPNTYRILCGDYIELHFYRNKLIKKGELNFIGIHEYKNSSEMEEDAKKINPKTGMVGGAIVDYADAVHFYKGGTVIVRYIGHNKEVIGTIEKVLGKQFAGD